MSFPSTLSMHQAAPSSQRGLFEDIFNTIGNSVSDIVIMLDCNMNVKLFNERACSMLKREITELKGAAFDSLFPKQQQEFYKLAMEELQSQEAINNRRSCFYVKGSKQLAVSISMSKIRENGQLIGYLITASDDKELTQTCQALSEKNAELETLIYRISHDLKGPLSSMKGLLSLIEMESGSFNASSEYFPLIKKSTQKLDEKLMGLLELGLSKNDKIQLEHLNVRKILQDVISDFDNFPGRKETYIHLTANERLMIQSEPKLLYSVLQNLIENAIKYRKTNTLESVIKVSARKSGQAIKIKIKDNGQGMDKESLSHVFDMFYRANPEVEGSGLGMFIVKSHISKLEGKISISSKPKHGTEITLVFPAKA